MLPCVEKAVGRPGLPRRTERRTVGCPPNQTSVPPSPIHHSHASSGSLLQPCSCPPQDLALAQRQGPKALFPSRPSSWHFSLPISAQMSLPGISPTLTGLDEVVLGPIVPALPRRALSCNSLASPKLHPPGKGPGWLFPHRIPHTQQQRVGAH